MYIGADEGCTGRHEGQLPVAIGGQRSDFDEQHVPCLTHSLQQSPSSAGFICPLEWGCSYLAFTWICSQYIKTNCALRSKAKAASNAGPQKETGRTTLSLPQR